MPLLEKRNELTWNVFTYCSSQMVVAGMGTPLGIQFAAIDRALDHFGIHPLDRDRVFNRVRVLGELHAELLIDKQRRSMPAEQRRSMEPEVQPPPMWSKEELARIEAGELF